MLDFAEKMKSWNPDTDSPESRCINVNPKVGQCTYQAVPGGTVCYMHGGNKTIQSQKQHSLNMYRLGQYQARVEQLSENDRIKSLRDEIGILRMLVEERFAILHTPTDIIMHTAMISDLIMKIERVVSTCHKLESSLGGLLDKQKVIEIASQILAIIRNHVNDANIIEAIASDMLRIFDEEN